MSKMDNREQVGKPFAGFDDFDDCLSTFEDDPDIDDPGALCGWLEQNKEIVSDFDPNGQQTVLEFIEELDNPEATTILTDLEVSFVSGVESPAQDSQWLYAKDGKDGVDWGVSTPLVVTKDTAKQPNLFEDRETAVEESEDMVCPTGAHQHGDQWMPCETHEDWQAAQTDKEEGEEEQKAWAPVLIPNEADKQGDVIPPSEIEDAAHTFLKDYRQIDTDHDLLDGKGDPIESWTLKEEQDFVLPDGDETRSYPAGTWMMGVQFGDDAWKRIKDGELTGFSIYGEAEPLDISALMGDNTTGDEDMKGSQPPDASMDTDGIKRTVLQSIKKQDGFEDPCWEGYEMVGTKVDENGNEVPNCVPEDDVPEAQAQSVDGDDMTEANEEDNTEKELDADAMAQLAEAMRAYFDDLGGTVEGTDLETFMNWALGDANIDDLDDVVEVGGVEIPIRPEDGEDGETEEDMGPGDHEEEDGMHEEDGVYGEEEMEMSEEGEMKDENDSETGGIEEILETVKDTNGKVNSLDNRVDDLEAEVFDKDEDADAEDTAEVLDEATIEEATEKAVAKMFADDDEVPEDSDERAEIVRKHIHETSDSESGSRAGEWDVEDIKAGYGGDI